jgi:hypothetical protein
MIRKACGASVWANTWQVTADNVGTYIKGRHKKRKLRPEEAHSGRV